MSNIYAATYEGKHIGGSARADLWKIGASDKPETRVKATTGTLRARGTLHKVWRGRGRYEYDAIRAAQRAFGGASGEWFTAPRSRRKQVIALIGRAISTAHAQQLGASGLRSRRAAAVGRRPTPRSLRHLQRTRTRRAIVPQRYTPS